LPGAPKPTLYGAISPEVEPKLVEGYLSIRRAEEAGGEVSEMVGLLNRALVLAQSGRVAEAEELVSRIIAMEPEVTRLGLYASRMKLYTSIGVLAATSTAGVGCFVYFRRRVWVYWARLHKDWRIVWTGGDFEAQRLGKSHQRSCQIQQGNPCRTHCIQARLRL